MPPGGQQLAREVGLRVPLDCANRALEITRDGRQPLAAFVARERLGLEAFGRDVDVPGGEIDALEQLFAGPSFITFSFVELHPVFDVLRDDPRYLELRRQHGTPQE